jgi:hypothetical protein
LKPSVRNKKSHPQKRGGSIIKHIFGELSFVTLVPVTAAASAIEVTIIVSPAAIKPAILKAVVIEPTVAVSTVTKVAVVMVSGYISAIVFPVVPSSIESYTVKPVTVKIGMHVRTWGTDLEVAA